MEKHFLEDMMKGHGAPTFRAEPWYNSDGDCIIYKMADEAVVADRIDDLLTIYRSAEDNRAIGFQIKGAAAIINKYGFAALAVSSEAAAGSVRRVSIAALLLAAYEERSATVDRRIGYAAAMGFSAEKNEMPMDELQPA